MIDIFTYLFIQWRLKFFIRIRNLIFVSSYHSIFKNQALTTKKHKAIIYTQSSLSNKKVNLTRYQLYINWMKIYISMVRKIWLVPCMCFNDVYVKISYHFIFKHAFGAYTKYPSVFKYKMITNLDIDTIKTHTRN